MDIPKKKTNPKGFSCAPSRSKELPQELPQGRRSHCHSRPGAAAALIFGAVPTEPSDFALGMLFSEGAQQQAEPGIARDEWKIREVGGLRDFFPPSFVSNPELTNVALLLPEFGGRGGGGTKALSHGYHFGISTELLTNLVVPSPLPNPGKNGI